VAYTTTLAVPDERHRFVWTNYFYYPSMGLLHFDFYEYLIRVLARNFRNSKEKTLNKKGA